MTNYILDNATLSAKSAKELIRKMHRASHAPAPDDRTWMLQVADRTEVQSGTIIRTDTPENFVEDLIKNGLIEKVD